MTSATFVTSIAQDSRKISRKLCLQSGQRCICFFVVVVVIVVLFLFVVGVVVIGIVLVVVAVNIVVGGGVVVVTAIVADIVAMVNAATVELHG